MLKGGACAARSPRENLNPTAYNALADALTVIYWNKSPFERYLRGMPRNHSELVAQLGFRATKRETSGLLVDLLRANEVRYFDVTLELMLDVAELERFPDLEQQVDRAEMVAKAQAAAEELRRWTKKLRESVKEHRDHAAAMAASAQAARDTRLFAEDHEVLKRRLLSGGVDQAWVRARVEHGGTRRTERRAVAEDQAVVAGERSAGWAVVGSPHGGEWGAVPGSHRGALAGPAGAVRSLADRLRTASPLVGGRYLAADPGRAADGGRCHRSRGGTGPQPGTGMGGQHRLHLLPGPPARGRGPSPGRRDGPPPTGGVRDRDQTAKAAWSAILGRCPSSAAKSGTGVNSRDRVMMQPTRVRAS